MTSRLAARALRYLAGLILWALALALLVAAVWGVASIAVPERQVSSAPRGAPVSAVGIPVSSVSAPAFLGVPTGLIRPRDPDSVGAGAPLPTATFGAGIRTRHSAGLAVERVIPSPAPSARSQPTVAGPPPVETAPRGAVAGPWATGAPSSLLQALPSDCRLPCYNVERSGPASWYRDPRAGPNALYAAIPGYTGGVMAVVVCSFPDGQANCLTLPVTTSCGCLRHTRDERVVDLSPAAFVLFEPDLRVGLVRVQITVLR